MMMHFGEHITIDGYDGNAKRLDDPELVRSCLAELARRLKMHPLAKPRVVAAPDNHIKDPGGWSAFLLIAESHISMHTFPRRGFLSADVYSCQNGIDAEFVVEFFRKKFRLGDVERRLIKRGLKYPKHNKF